MNVMQIEAIIGSPPERDELVVQLFAKDGGQWAEAYREQGVYMVELYVAGSPMRFRLDEMISALGRSLDELRALDDPSRADG